MLENPRLCRPQTPGFPGELNQVPQTKENLFGKPCQDLVLARVSLSVFLNSNRITTSACSISFLREPELCFKAGSPNRRFGNTVSASSYLLELRDTPRPGLGRVSRSHFLAVWGSYFPIHLKIRIRLLSRRRSAVESKLIVELDEKLERSLEA